ncbi:MAG: phosphoribosylamine--glycine ligase [bacterium]
MRVLILGSGGREHALAWGFQRDPQVRAVYCAPGNGGTAELGENVAWDGKDFERVHELTSDLGIDLIVPGSEEPLVRGLTDFCLERGLPALGPTAQGAQLEGSKRYGKEFCRHFSIPTALAFEFTDPNAAWSHVRDCAAPPVLKADGLAAGKGVLLPETRQEAQEAIQTLMVDRAFGAAGATILVEERLVGYEASLMCASDGHTLRPLAYAMDYKRAGDGDSGPNTGGMGVLSPHPRLTNDDIEAINTEVVSMAARGLREWKLDYRGILYIGLMMTATGPKVIEFNCRWGDPETQGIIPRLRTPLGTLYEAMRTGTLESIKLEIDDSARVGVVLAATGYPGTYAKGIPLDVFRELVAHEDLALFHAGTDRTTTGLRSTGGRVACLVGAGESLKDARRRVYDVLGKNPMEGLFWRSDIGS